MAFESHPDFKPPSNPDGCIWRYMEFTKLLSLLDKEALYFARLDHLAEFDPFEGSYTYQNLAFDEIKYNDVPKEYWEKMGIVNEGIFNSFVQSNKQSRNITKKGREMTFVNSWHVGDHESAAMWKIYLASDAGIAIRSTYNKLKDSLFKYTEFGIFIGMIEYLDYKTQIIKMDNALRPFISKRKSFEHENELRALIWTPQHGKNDIRGVNNKFASRKGLYVDVDLDTLIESIFVSPNAPAWFVELVESATKKFGFPKSVEQSDLSEGPIY